MRVPVDSRCSHGLWNRRRRRDGRDRRKGRRRRDRRRRGNRRRRRGAGGQAVGGRSGVARWRRGWAGAWAARRGCRRRGGCGRGGGRLRGCGGTAFAATAAGHCSDGNAGGDGQQSGSPDVPIVHVKPHSCVKSFDCQRLASAPSANRLPCEPVRGRRSTLSDRRNEAVQQGTHGPRD